MGSAHAGCTADASYEPFAQKFNKFTVRDFHNNTRMNINNVEYANKR